MIVQCLRSDARCFGHYNRPCYLLTYLLTYCWFQLILVFVRHSQCGCGCFAAYSVVLFLNVLGAMAYFFGCLQSDLTTESSGVTFALSIVFFILFIPCSFICWYRPLYKAFRFDLLICVCFLVVLCIYVYCIYVYCVYCLCLSCSISYMGLFLK